MSDGVEQRPRRERANGRTGPMTAAEMRVLARDRLIESRLTPNAISMTGLVGNLIAAVLILQEHFVLAAIAFILGSLCDTVDGRYSRMSGKGSPFGAFLDSTLDRIEEGVVLAAVAVWFAKNSNEIAVAATVLTVVGSYMVSYTRARAEALGVECKVGIASRAVRVVASSRACCSRPARSCRTSIYSSPPSTRWRRSRDLHHLPAGVPREEAAGRGPRAGVTRRRVRGLLRRTGLPAPGEVVFMEQEGFCSD